jgi:hypothetical protein
LFATLERIRTERHYKELKLKNHAQTTKSTSLSSGAVAVAIIDSSL